MLCGDFNCPGCDSVSIDTVLDDVLSSRDLEQLVSAPTRADSLLDLVVSAAESQLVTRTSTSEVGFFLTISW